MMLMRRSPLVKLAVVLALGVGAGSLLDGCSSDEDEKSVAPPSFYRSLCEAQTRTAGGDVQGAARLWVNRVHGPLHPLAADASKKDRAVAGRLLRAKEAVEAAWQAKPDEVPGGLAELAEATRAAVRTVDGRDPGGCR